MPLLLVDRAVAFEDLVDPRHIRPKLLRRRPLAPPIARRRRILQHLRDRVPVDAEPLRRLPTAQPVHHHRTSYPGIEFHCEHPFDLSMPFRGIEIGLTGPVHFCAAFSAANHAGSVVHFVTAIYNCLWQYLNMPFVRVVRSSRGGDNAYRLRSLRVAVDPAYLVQVRLAQLPRLRLELPLQLTELNLIAKVGGAYLIHRLCVSSSTEPRICF